MAVRREPGLCFWAWLLALTRASGIPPSTLLKKDFAQYRIATQNFFRDIIMADIIFDVDGTLMDITHRRHFVTQRPKDFDSFRSHTEFDTRKEDIFAIADALQAQLSLIHI